MPALAFGLKTSKPLSGLSKPSQKRKAVFEDDDQNDDDSTAAVFQAGPKKISKPLTPLNPLQAPENEENTSSRPSKSPKLSEFSPALRIGKTDKYSNLSALRSAKLHDEQASSLDSSIYDYDGVYDTFQASTAKKNSSNGEPSGPKYMTSLLVSAEQRKRDQLRAREKVLQREREQEGDEFADKEKFVTGAYKKQQQELKVMEEEEKKRVEEEEERRRKGMGMTEWNRRVLQKDEERTKMIEESERQRKEGGVVVETGQGDGDEDVDGSKMAKDLNEKGGHIIVNDEGEVVDKRQLLSAGLNAAPKKPGQTTDATKAKVAAQPQEYHKSSQARNAREAQRERQSRMMERQLEEITSKQQEADAEEEKAREEKTKSKITEADKMSAKERYLQRKKEREEEARKAKEGKGG